MPDAITFNGTDEYAVRTHGSAIVSGTDDFTLVGWVRSTDAADGTKVIAALTSSSSDTVIESIRLTSGGRLLWRYNNGGGNVDIEGPRWQYAGVKNLPLSIVARKVGNTRQIYCNGYLEGEDTASANVGTLDQICFGNQVRTTADSVHFAGTYACWGLYLGSLTTAQIETALQDGFPSVTFDGSDVGATVFGMYPFDGDVADISGNGNDLTGTGLAAGNYADETQVGEIHASRESIVANATARNPYQTMSPGSATDETFEWAVDPGCWVSIEPVYDWDDVSQSFPERVWINGGIGLSPNPQNRTGLANKVAGMYSHPVHVRFLQSRGICNIVANASRPLLGYSVVSGSQESKSVDHYDNGMHSSPHAALHTDGNVYRAHTTTRYGIAAVSKNGDPWAYRDWVVNADDQSRETNENKHPSATVISVPGKGLAFFNAHHGEGIDLRGILLSTVTDAELPDMPDNLPLTTTTFHSTLTNSYSQANYLGDYLIHVTRSDSSSGTCNLSVISDGFDSGSRSADLYYLGNLGYPQGTAHLPDGGLALFFAIRPSSEGTTQGCAALKLYLDASGNPTITDWLGNAASGVGTSGDPFVDMTTENVVPTSSSFGVQVVPSVADTQRYSIGHPATDGESIWWGIVEGATDGSWDASDDYGPRTLKLFKFTDGTSSEVDLPSAIQTDVDSLRVMGCCLYGGGKLDFIIGDRGNVRGSRPVAEGALSAADVNDRIMYYDTGVINPQRWRTPTFGTPSWSLIEDLPVEGEGRSGLFTPIHREALGVTYQCRGFKTQMEVHEEGIPMMARTPRAFVGKRLRTYMAR